MTETRDRPTRTGIPAPTWAVYAQDPNNWSLVQISMPMTEEDATDLREELIEASGNRLFSTRLVVLQSGQSA